MGVKQPSQVIHWVTGKGGVGKSTIAASLALSLARAGRRTLLVELGDKSFFRYVFERDISYQAQSLRDNLWIAKWDGEECLKEYLLYLLRLERVVELFFENKVMKSLVQAAPGLRELALVGKITSGVRGVGPTLNYDCLVVDAFATGHFKALVGSPDAMAQAVSLGPMGEQSRSMDQVLHSNVHSRYHVVTVPEELPVTEGLELAQFLKTKGTRPTIYFNRWLDPPVSLEYVEKHNTNEFTEYLSTVMARAKNLWAEAEPSGFLLKRIPYSWETSALHRVEQLSKLFDSEWK